LLNYREIIIDKKETKKSKDFIKGSDDLGHFLKIKVQFHFFRLEK